MKSEIAWLMEAFLEEDPKRIRVMIKDRMAEVTESLTSTRLPPTIARASQILHEYLPDGIPPQAPSTQRILAQNPDLIPKPPTPVTPAAAQALAAREALMRSAGKDKPENGRTSPRKI